MLVFFVLAEEQACIRTGFGTVTIYSIYVANPEGQSKVFRMHFDARVQSLLYHL